MDFTALILLTLSHFFAVEDGSQQIVTRRQIRAELVAWDGILELIGSSIDPINSEIEYLYSKTRRRAVELELLKSQVPSFLLWSSLQDYLAQSGMYRHGPEDKFVGKCATGTAKSILGDLFYAFIVNYIRQRGQRSVSRVLP